MWKERKIKIFIIKRDGNFRQEEKEFEKKNKLKSKEKRKKKNNHKTEIGKRKMDKKKREKI